MLTLGRLPCATSGANQHLIMRNEKNVALQPGYKEEEEGVLLYIDDLVVTIIILVSCERTVEVLAIFNKRIIIICPFLPPESLPEAC